MDNTNRQHSPVSYETQCELASLTKIQCEIESVMQQWFDDDIKLNFTTLSIVEVLANIFEHGFDQSTPDKQNINLAINKKSGLVSAIITDNGKRIPANILAIMSGDQLHMPDITVNIVDLPDSGWGLNLVQHATKSINYKRKKDTNYLELVFDIGAEK